MSDDQIILPGGATATKRTHTAPRAKPTRARIAQKASARESDLREEPLQRGERLQRARKRTEDRFYIDPKMIPPGVSYEWKRSSCYGRPDTDHVTGLMDNHWAAVPQERHPGTVVEKDGMILMERPAYLTHEAQTEDYNVAMDEVTRVTRGLSDAPAGTFTRQHPSAKRVTGIKTERVGALMTGADGQLIVPD